MLEPAQSVANPPSWLRHLTGQRLAEPHVRSIEIMDQRGLLDELLDEGTQYPLDGVLARERAQRRRISTPITDTYWEFHSHVFSAYWSSMPWIWR